MDRNSTKNDLMLGRRRLLIGAASAIAAPSILHARNIDTKQLVYVSYGGTTQEAQEKTIHKSFEANTGIKILSTTGPDIAKLKAQVMTGNVEWDVVSFIGSQALAAQKAGLLEKLDYQIINTSGLAIGKEEYCVPWYVYGGGMAYDPKRTPPEHAPKNWVEFWDSDNFPGRRGLRSRPDENLELALVADGVDPKSLYPLDVNRAFKSLDRIKPHVAKWIAETPQTISLLQTNEIDFVFTYSSRAEQAQANGNSIAYIYKHNIVTPSYLCIPKGSRNKKSAMELINFYLQKDQQADFVNITHYTPVNSAARILLTPEAKASQIDLTDNETIITNVEWWADNFAEVNHRFSEWRIS
ncbi:ABC transporter substrate-binding protein [Allopusillimonas ginsengisoli]|uniref:ABC transporter substrate-binding protein n=1 Tax=Allopusillimonas ginsengisoli TaxID=453575 RepID=UPI00101FCD11|nr:ABC transporter substrate-binding protein [Allopusillimonas ginsengisoli]TEA74180.1 ABC transporter substrate-binding protein [Allopusillimonas ginsengisoli]